MADEPGKRTAGSSRALGLAELVNKLFENERVPSSLAAHAGYRIQLAGLESMTTTASAGLQHQLKLVPADAADSKPEDGGAATIVIGVADVNLTQLELRTYDELAKRHSTRFGGDALPIDRATYDALRTKVEAALAPQGIETVSSSSRQELTVRPASLVAGSKPLWAFVAVGVVVAVAAVFFALKK
jgi:hypothetical protein